MLRIPIIVTITFLNYSFFQFFSSEEPTDRAHFSFNYYFNSEPLRDVSVDMDCIDEIRVNQVRKELSSMIRWRTRSTSIIDGILDDMESCDSTYFVNDPIYHLLLSINNRDRNRYLAYVEGLKAYELFEIQNDTSGMVNALYFFAYISWENDRQKSDFYTDKLLSLAKASSNKRDNLLYYNIFLRNLPHNPNIGEINYDKYVDSVRQIVKQDSSLILDYSTILGIVTIVAYYDGKIEKAHNYRRENYALLNANQDYLSVMNYAETFTEDHQRDSMLHYYNIVFEKYSQAAYKPAEFLAFFYGRKSDYYKRYNDIDEAWHYRNLKDSIYSILENLEEKSKIQEYKSKLAYNTQELNNKQLEIEKSFLLKTNIFLLLLLFTFILLSLNYYKRKEEAQNNLKFKEKAFRLISHDMLSPLQVLTGYIEMIKRKASEESRLNMNKPLNVISNHVNRLSDLAHNTIDYIWQSNKVI